MLKFKEIISEVRKTIPTGIVDVQVDFLGEFVSDDEKQTEYSGRYHAEIRFDEENNVVKNYTCVRSFETDDGEEFDPHIATSEMEDFEYYPFEIIGAKRVGN